MGLTGHKVTCATGLHVQHLKHVSPCLHGSEFAALSCLCSRPSALPFTREPGGSALRGPPCGPSATPDQHFPSLPTPRNTKHRGTGRKRRKRRRKQKTTSAPVAATQTPATRRRWRGEWAGADMGRAEPGKPSWSGMTPPSHTSAPPVPTHCPFCKPHPMYVSLSLSPPISMTLWAGLPQPPGTRPSCGLSRTPALGWFQEVQPLPQWGLRGGLCCHAHCSCP